MGGAMLSAEQRRSALKSYAGRQLGEDNKAQAFLNILNKAVSLSAGGSDPGAVVAGDIKAVLIGDGFTPDDGRGSGPHFVGNYAGATGFKPHLRDPYNQVQHAAAGLVIGHDHSGSVYGSLMEKILVDSEDDDAQPQDARLYRVMFPIGQWLQDLDKTFVRPDAMFIVPGADDAERLKALPALVMQAICDETCVKPSDDPDDDDPVQPFDMEADARIQAFDMEAEADAEASDQSFDMRQELPDDDEPVCYPDDDEDEQVSYPDDEMMSFPDDGDQPSDAEGQDTGDDGDALPLPAAN